MNENQEVQPSEDSFSVVGFLNNYLREKQNEHTPSKNFNASDMGKCYLMRYWKRQGKEGEELDDRSLRNFAVGDVFHDFFQKITAEKGISILSEDKMTIVDEEGNVLLSGRPDDLIRTPTGKLILYDYKTVHSKKFHYLVGGERDKHYEKQVLVYYLMLKDKFPELNDLRILYISKDDLCLKEMPVWINDKTVAAVKKEIDEINDYWKRQVEPPAQPQADWECKYCPYQSVCPYGKETIRADVQKKAFRDNKSIKL